LPKGLGADIDLSAINVPPVFGWLQSAGNIAQDEMLRTFNCGVGMVVICAPEHAEAATQALSSDRWSPQRNWGVSRCGHPIQRHMAARSRH
jgi:phosphoribosylformylglycinamidine cyclo-ligase